MRREHIPKVKEIATSLAKKICESLEINLPEALRERTSPTYDRTFENAVQHLREQGYSPIRKRRFHMFTYNPPVDSDGTSQTYPSPVCWEPIPLDSLEQLEEGEFWIPVGFDGFKTWESEACAPHWIKTRSARTRWCNKHGRETKWPDHGETSEDPTRFINNELAGLKSDLKGSPEVSKKHRKRLREKLQDLGVIGSEYLAEAIELALKVGGAPLYQQVSKKNLLDHEGISSYVDKNITRILELAYRAGRVDATYSAYYRGVPYMAQDGAPTVLRAGKGRPKAERQKKKPKLRKWQKISIKEMDQGGKIDRRNLLEFLVGKGAIQEDSPGVYRETETPKGGQTFTYESFRKKLNRFITSQKMRTV